jgi:hypothetical protein
MAPKIRTLSEIKSKLLRPATTSHFECVFTPPGDVKKFIEGRKLNITPITEEKINISCCDASLPGSTLQTATLTDSYTGVTENYAYRRSYDNRADFSFYVDNSGAGAGDYYSVILFFENWTSYIVGEDSLNDQSTTNYFYRVNFPENYIAKALTIYKFEKDYNTSRKYLKYDFIGAFPLSIASTPVSYESSQLLKYTVSFSYLRYVLSTETGPLQPTSRP